MAVRLPSDLVMDVMRNADPARRNAAVARLETAAQPAERQVAFQGMVDALAPEPAVAPGPTLSLPFAEGRSAAREAETPYLGFEKMVLRNLFETLLPESGTGAFGSGPSAGVWRSMAADQMAGVYTDAGGIGIARMLEQRDGGIDARQSQWPYFRAAPISGFTG